MNRIQSCPYRIEYDKANRNELFGAGSFCGVRNESAEWTKLGGQEYTDKEGLELL